MTNQSIIEYAQSGMYNQLFDDVLYTVQSATDYLETESLYYNARLDNQEKKYFGKKCLELTNKLASISKVVLQYKALAKGEINELETIDLPPYDLEINHDLPFKFNLLLTNSKHLYDRITRIDNQFKKDKVSYFDNLNIKL